jgi:hypothetical protein
MDPLISFSFVDPLNDNQKFLILVIVPFLMTDYYHKIQHFHLHYLRQLNWLLQN